MLVYSTILFSKILFKQLIISVWILSIIKMPQSTTIQNIQMVGIFYRNKTEIVDQKNQKYTVSYKNVF